MSGGAADIGALLDLGPELPSYDPAWEARWDKANALLTLLRERDPKESSELTARLVGELCQACSSRFQFACDLRSTWPGTARDRRSARDCRCLPFPARLPPRR